MAGLGLPKAVTTTGGLKRAMSSKSCVKRVLEEWVTKLAHQGPKLFAAWVSRASAKPFCDAGHPVMKLFNRACVGCWKCAYDARLASGQDHFRAGN
jgi:hypothetical protein